MLGKRLSRVMQKSSSIVLLLLSLCSIISFISLKYSKINFDNNSWKCHEIFLPTNQKKIEYSTRKGFEECQPKFGVITVLVIYVKQSYDTHYRVAQETLKCYIKSTNYKLILIDLNSDPRVNAVCGHKDLFFKKHCASSVYLNETDWMLVLDADSGVVNPKHCIEEWIDSRVDVILYERFFNWEIASGNYLVKNTPFARKFLKDWADWEFKQPNGWTGADNGALQIHVLKTVMPEARQEIENCEVFWKNASSYNSYMAYVTCVKIYLGATRIWPEKIKIYKRGHAWIRDGFITNDGWCDRDFMLHGWKLQNINIKGWDSPFKSVPNSVLCGPHEDEWHWRPEKIKDCNDIKKSYSQYESSAMKNFPKEGYIIPYLSLPDVANCFPNCETA